VELSSVSMLDAGQRYAVHDQLVAGGVSWYKCVEC